VIIDTNGCTINESISLTEPVILDASISSHIDVGCKDEATGSALSNVSGGTSPYTYNWNTSPVQTNPAATNLFAGTYAVTVTDNNGCADVASVIINEPADSLSAAITSVTNVFCNGDATGGSVVLANGGTTPYSYNWNSSPVQTTSTATNLLAGNYTVIITDTNACTVSLPVTITEPQFALNVTITDSTDVLCKGDSNGSATALASGGSGSYTYSWNSSPIQVTPTASNLIAGTYTATVTDNNGCLTPSTAIITINEPALNLSSSSVLSSYVGGYNISCNGATDGDINQTIVGGTAPYVVLWTGPDSFTSNLEDVNSLQAGAYYLEIVDDNACAFYDTITLTEPTLINIAVTVTDATCPAFFNGAIDLTISGGTPGYTFSWVGPNGFISSIEDISGLEAGDYDLIVTDNNTCTKAITITVSQPGTLTLSNTTSSYIGGLNVSCNGAFDGTIDIAAGGGTVPYGFSWTGPNGFTSIIEDINGLEAGPYQVIFTDNNGCFVSDSIYLAEPDVVAMTLTPSLYNGNYNISCNSSSDGTINTVPSGGIAPYTYSWTGSNAYSSSNQNINTLIAGRYILTITDVNGCTGIDSITLTQPDTLLGTNASPVYQGGYNISCFGLANGSVDLTVAGGTSPFLYAWTGPNGFTSTLEDINNLLAGTYSVQITDDNGCTHNSSITLTQPDSLSLTTVPLLFNGGYNVSCNGFSDGAIDLTVVGGTSPFTFNWSNGGVNEDLSNIQAGSYSVIVTDTNNCTANTSVTLTQPQPLQAGITSPTYIGGNNVSCNGSSDGSVDLQVSGGTPSYVYNWIGPNGFTSTIEDPTALEAGTYQVTITDTNSCSKVDFITLLEPAILDLTLNSPTYIGGFNLSCNNDSTGVIDLTVIGGIPMYNYSWTGSSAFSNANQDIANLIAGTYYITVTDTNSCVSLDSLTITEPNPLSSTALLSTYAGGNNISCNGSNDGAIDLTMNGGNLNYTYSWSGPNGFLSTNEDITNLIVGTYLVNAIDTNGCTYDTTITLSEPSELIDSIYTPTFIGENHISCNGLSDGAIDAFITGGTTPFTISWAGPNTFASTSFNISGLEAGFYYYTITDVNSCTLSDSIELIQPDTLKSVLTTTLFPSGHNIACMGDTTGLIYTAVSGGIGGFTFNWSNSNTFNSSVQNPDSLLADTYYLLLSDTNGCTWNDSIVLSEPNSIVSGIITPSIYPSGDNISCDGLNDGDLSVVANGGTPGYIFDWRGPNGYSNDSTFIDLLFIGVYDLRPLQKVANKFTSYFLSYFSII